MTDMPRLSSIYYNPVGTCNLRCAHCWVEADTDAPGPARFEQRERRGDELTFVGLQQILKEALHLGLEQLKFTGGEPFLRQDTMDMMEWAAGEGIRITVETNGTLLNDGLIDRLASLEPQLVAVSLDSVNPQRHDSFRGAKGAHRRAVAAIKGLAKAGCRVQTIMAVTRSNLSEVESMLATAKDMGAQSVKLCPVAPMGRGRAIQEAGDCLSISEFIDLYRSYGNCADYGCYACVAVPAAFRSVKDLKRQTHCRIKNIIGLLPNGDVSYCGIGMAHPDLTMGNALRDGLRAIWERHPRFEEIREGLPGKLQGICSQCILKAACLGGCRAYALVLSGSIFAPDWFCAQAAREGLYPASRLADPTAVCVGATDRSRR